MDVKGLSSLAKSYVELSTEPLSTSVRDHSTDPSPRVGPIAPRSKEREDTDASRSYMELTYWVGCP